MRILTFSTTRFFVQQLMLIRILVLTDLADLQALASEADAEGFGFVTRFLDDLAAGRAAFDTPHSRFVGAAARDRLIALGGITPDPYTTDANIGRLRHLYVQPHARGQGIGRQLVHSLEAWAAPTYTVLRLRTDTPAAARFYEHLGYQPIADRAATHSRSLVDVRERSVEASPQLS